MPLNPSPPPTLPPKYYLGHFQEMIDFIAFHYAHVLAPSHLEFLKIFAALPEDARCLYVRLANRKGQFFSQDQLRYPEIDDLPRAASLLIERKLLRHPDADDFAELLAHLSRDELLAKLRQTASATEAPLQLSTKKKPALIQLCLKSLDFSTAFPKESLVRYLVTLKKDEVEYLLFLYFGTLRRDLSTFARRDLGQVKTATYRSDFQARFRSQEVALACFYYAQRLERLENIDVAEALALAEEIKAWPDNEDAEVTLLRHRTLHRLGRSLERLKYPDEALAVYNRSDHFPSTERIIRLLFATGRQKEAETRLRRCLASPSCDEELVFAEDFLERKFGNKKRGRLTELLRSSPVLELDESGRDYPEAAAAAAISRRGELAAYVENRLWQQLFGLCFWDLLFGPEHAAVHAPFDFTPSDLAAGTFLVRKQLAIKERLALFKTPQAALDLLKTTWSAHFDTPNSLVQWDEELFTLTCRLVATAPPSAISKILLEMARDPRNNHSGFPDLLIFDDEGPRFLEIKTQGDQLRRRQLIQLDRLKLHGFRVGIAQVKWIIDPEQEYVVVDLEATGGEIKTNRITEIGAVRVRNGRILEEWSSLVNPERRIPPFVAKLTGISQAMVENAPRFAEIADEFRAFVGDAVLVAHRAKIDYGFLKSEYYRLDQSFQLPTLCTVVEMRRYFPGLFSYGLSALCSQFGIPLESHHRALCDAHATAQLLLRINQKRLAYSSSEKLP